ncbi:MAG: zinc-binding dehydrogenase [Armatimonadota bacterium]|nr:zinc-binding dehydrogenase [Armatimonadota bacterium]
MKILQVTTPQEFAILEVPIPRPGSGQVLVRVEAVTTCPQWDLHLRHNEPMFPGHRFNYPYTPGQPGHEATGEIVAVGPGVCDVAVGDRVSVWRDPGHILPGCYAQYVLAASDNVIRVPPALPPAATAPVELAMCVGATFLMLKQMDGLRGRRCGVTGLGPAGLIAVQMARAEGAAQVIGFDLSAARRERALALGADAAYDPRADLDHAFPARPGKAALDCAVDCVGAKASVEFLMDRTADVVALFGVQREEYTFAPRHYMKLRLFGYPGHSRIAAEYAVRLLENRSLNLAALVTHHLPLEKYGLGVDLLEAQQAVKVCFWPWRTE